LSLFAGELIQILPHEWPKGRRVLYALLPLQRLLWGREELLEFLGDLVSLRRHRTSPPLSFLEADDLRLIGIKHTLALPCETLPALEPGGLRRGASRELLLCRLRPRLVQLRNQLGCPSSFPQRVPPAGIEPIGADTP
jgi:hypothetical protein